MATKSKARLQAKSQRRQLAKLKSAGLYSGKIDGRKKPSKYQQSLISKYKDVATGKASVVKPKDAKSYKQLFQVVGDKVIVPRRKGEKIWVTKRGTIVGERKVGDRVVKTRFKRIPHGGVTKEPKTPRMYFLPFIRGKDKNGKPILEWKRFPNYKFMSDYMSGSASVTDYKDWADYIVEESFAPDTPQETINDKLNKKIGKKRKKIRFADDEDE